MKKKLKPIMFVGTGSDVGKSVINAAFCRIFVQDGYNPAPFKAQNMSLNSYATPDDLEIGRAQAMQAEACRIGCSVEMNPVLLKPTSYLSSQVVLNGRPIGNKTASEYFVDSDRDKLFREAMKGFRSLEAEHNPIVIEGAGSISELNLWDKDITNMRVALETGASAYLITDIDRGGVFASVYGTIKLLPTEQRELIKGIIINKFRGDINLFEEGKKILENLVQKPVVGIIPFFKDIFIEQEDSVVIENKTSAPAPGKINIAVVLLPHLSNFTDFDNLERIPEVHLFYSDNPREIEKADIVVLPGSKNTMADLQYIKEKRIDRIILQLAKTGKQVYGICGGFQMMGQEIKDPYRVEGQQEEIEGLGILPISTVLTTVKKTQQTKFRFRDNEAECAGYEIHMGETRAAVPSPLCRINDSTDGYYFNEQIWGTYIHGIFDNPVVVENILKQIKKDIRVDFNYRAFKDKEFDKLANLVREAVNMEYIYKTLQI
jgi:adenosylcobyric acid synthase